MPSSITGSCGEPGRLYRWTPTRRQSPVSELTNNLALRELMEWLQGAGHADELQQSPSADDLRAVE
jgi:hypothetical protein